jgi:starch-binding outer membrane protein, SusD/RagB family
MKKSIIYISFMLLFLGSSLSCEKKLDQTNPNFLSPNTYFKTAGELLSGTNAVYSAVRGSNLVAREWFFTHDLRSGEVASGGGQLEAPRAQILGGTAIDASNSVLTSVWNGLYIVVHRANTVIGSAANVTDNAALRDRAVAEAKFLRAWAYYELGSTWGDVPVYTEVVTGPDQYQGKSPVANVYAAAEKDLKEAIAVLPASFTGDDLGRATKGAANALLAKVFLQDGKTQDAKDALTAVISSGLYSLTAEYEDNFREETEFNQESVFEVVFVSRADNGFNWGGTGDDITQANSTVMAQEVSPLQWRNLIPSDAYLNEFETGDPRYKKSVYETGDTYAGGAVLTDADQNGNSSVVHGVTKKVSWKKYTLLYKNPTKTTLTPSGINQRIIRYADVLLMMAEAENELGNASAATGYINQVRKRQSVNMPDITATTKDAVRKAIIHERMVELGGEQVRDRDIQRWIKAGWFASNPLPNQPAVLPIPQQEIDNNPKL